MSIYTKTGDLGETSLFGGKRVLKNDDVVDVYGMIDEGNSYLGLIRSLLPTHESSKFLQEIQGDFHLISAFFAGSPGDLQILEERVKEMESQIDRMEQYLPPLNQFILPGGTIHASHIQIARSIVRSIERKIVFVQQQTIEKKDIQIRSVIQYINRLSDYLFVLARYVNHEEDGAEIGWDGGKKQR